MHDLIDGHPLGIVITASDEGLFATHIPFVLERDAGPLGTLRGHVARSNPHHRLGSSTASGLVVFSGPNAYVSPSLYPSKAEHGRVVPTWNYIAVHVHGPVRFIDDAAYVLANVEALTRRNEAGRPQPWSIHDAPRAYLDGLAQAIVGIEVPIARLEGKWKMSQNRDARDAEGVVAGLALGNDHEREVARHVAERLAAKQGERRDVPEN